MDLRYWKHKKLYRTLSIIGAFVLILIVWEIYLPLKPLLNDSIVFTAQKGMGDEEIAKALEDAGIIKNSYFMRGYVFLTMQDYRLQAGKYSLSPSMSVAQIVRKFVTGDVIRQNITILEGWDKFQISKYLEAKGVCEEKDFLNLINFDYSKSYSFLQDKPKDISLEGYLFPDTYRVSLGEDKEDFLKKMLDNFDKKLTAELRAEIKNQNKSIFEIITMASILEKEVALLNDKKIVSGILWKRIDVDMPLQVDSTVNYITGKSDAGVAIKDTKIDSPYNTYKYTGLPIGPISNPGLDSILAAIYPKDSPYWYYLSADGTGKTIFSKTIGEHNAARAKYLR